MVFQEPKTLQTEHCHLRGTESKLRPGTADVLSDVSVKTQKLLFWEERKLHFLKLQNLAELWISSH